MKNKIIKFSNFQYNFFDGIMASDACVDKNNRFSVGAKYEEFVSFITDILIPSNNVNKREYFDKRINKTAVIFYTKKQNVLFMSERKRWYPNGKKIIPNDFRFSPTSLLLWYLGDGSLAQNGMIKISTESFERENIENILIRYLRKVVGIDCWITEKNVVKISKYSKNTFLKFVGNCPVQCYKYKWNWEDVTVEQQNERDFRSSRLVGKIKSTEHRRKIGEANKKGKNPFIPPRIFTKEQKIKKSGQTSGINNPMYGKEHSKESRTKMAISSGSEPFLVYNGDEFIGEWINKKECSEALDLDNSMIGKCLKGKKKGTKGYTFVLKRFKK